jgi:outer membrane biosynthesis protein TonB
MADTTKKTKTSAKPRKTATKKEKVVKGSKPEKPPREKKEKVVKGSTAAKPSREEIERLANSYWEARGCQHGYDEQDWLCAEKELLKAASLKMAS